MTATERVSVEEYRRIIGVAAKPSKHHNVKTKVADIRFDSALEAKRYGQLKLLEGSGAIHDLKLQPQFVLQEGYKDSRGFTVRGIKYVADFSYMLDGQLVVEDVKGQKTQVFKLKEKLFRQRYPQIELRLLTKEEI